VGEWAHTPGPRWRNRALLFYLAVAGTPASRGRMQHTSHPTSTPAQSSIIIPGVDSCLSPTALECSAPGHPPVRFLHPLNMFSPTATLNHLPQFQFHPTKWAGSSSCQQYRRRTDTQPPSTVLSLRRMLYLIEVRHPFGPAAVCRLRSAYLNLTLVFALATRKLSTSAQPCCATRARRVCRPLVWRSPRSPDGSSSRAHTATPRMSAAVGLFEPQQRRQHQRAG
jgi:hypothetical protein